MWFSDVWSTSHFIYSFKTTENRQILIPRELFVVVAFWFVGVRHITWVIFDTVVFFSAFSGTLDCSSFILKYLNLFAPSCCYREVIFIWISLTCFRPKVKRFERPRRSFNISKCVSSMGLIFIQAENAYANGTHTSIVVSPWCVPVSLPLSLWQVSQSRLAFLELRSIFNRVAPLPDGPAIYGPERGQGWKWPGARGWRNVSDDRMMDECGAKMREPAMEESRGMGETWRLLRTKEMRVEGGGRQVFITLSARSVFFFFTDQLWRSEECEMLWLHDDSSLIGGFS